MNKTKKTNTTESTEKTYPLPTDKYYFRDQCLQAKSEFEPLLAKNIAYTGQYRCLRELALSVMPAEWVAKMQDEDLCDAMQVLYAYCGVGCDGEDIILVERSKSREYTEMRALYETVLSR